MPASARRTILSAFVLLLPSLMACADQTGSWDVSEGEGGGPDGRGPDASGHHRWDGPRPLPSATCGDGVMQPWEACDGGDHGAVTCGDFGFPSGELRCNARCAGFYVGECRGMPPWADAEDQPACRFDASSGDCLEPCSSEPLVGEVVFDVRTAEVSGELTGSLPEGEIDGRVTFVDTTTGAEYQARLVDGGLSVELFEGRYDVYVRLDGVVGGRRIRGNIAVPHGPFLWELPPVHTLRVDLDHGPRPSLAADVSIIVTPTDPTAPGDLADLEQGRSDRGETTLRVFEGTYDLEVNISGAPPVTRNWEWPLERRVVVAGPTARRYHIGPYRITGQLGTSLGLIADPGVEVEPLDGSPAPRARADRDDGAFELELPPGHYRLAASVPLDEEQLDWETIVTVTDADVDLGVVGDMTAYARVWGVVDAADASVSVSAFALHEADFVAGGPIQADGNYAMHLPPGHYRLFLRGDDDVAPLFGGEVVVGDEDLRVDLDASGLRSDLVRVEGQITLDAEARRITTEAYFGEVVFECLAPSCLYGQSADVDEGGRYGITLRPGRYRVVSVAQGFCPISECHTLDRVLPEGRYVLHPDLAIGESTLRDFDLKLVDVRGEVRAVQDELAPERWPDPRSGSVRGWHNLNARPSASVPYNQEAVFAYAFEELVPGVLRRDLELGGYVVHERHHVAEDLTIEEAIEFVELPLQVLRNGQPWPQDELGHLEFIGRNARFTVPANEVADPPLLVPADDYEVVLHTENLRAPEPNGALLLRRSTCPVPR